MLSDLGELATALDQEIRTQSTLGLFRRWKARRLARLIAGIVQIICTPVLDRDGNLNRETVDVLVRTRRLL